MPMIFRLLFSVCARLCSVIFYTFCDGAEIYTEFSPPGRLGLWRRYSDLLRCLYRGKGEIFRAAQTGLEAHSTSCRRVIRTFPGVKRRERNANHPPTSNAGLRMGRSYSFISPLCLHRHVIGRHLGLAGTSGFCRSSRWNETFCFKWKRAHGRSFHRSVFPNANMLHFLFGTVAAQRLAMAMEHE